MIPKFSEDSRYLHLVQEMTKDSYFITSAHFKLIKNSEDIKISDKPFGFLNLPSIWQLLTPFTKMPLDVLCKNCIVLKKIGPPLHK